MMKIFSKLSICFATFFITALALAEPTNLQVEKDQLKQYVTSGEYLKEQQQVATTAEAYLAKYIATNKQSKNPKKLAIVLDIDETSLSNYPDIVAMDFGGTWDELNTLQLKGVDPVIAPTLKLYNYAKENGVSVIFLTGRPISAMPATIRNLKAAGYKNWDGLVFRTKDNIHQPAEVYKTAVRKKLEAQGYDIVVNMGDQQSDLTGGYADKGFKLPNPFYYIP
ncbi:MAG: acid phosphatase [Legionellales bacterium]|nr:acid phosphatase [Legionellales bacterium]